MLEKSKSKATTVTPEPKWVQSMIKEPSREINILQHIYNNISQSTTKIIKNLIEKHKIHLRNYSHCKIA